MRVSQRNVTLILLFELGLLKYLIQPAEGIDVFIFQYCFLVLQLGYWVVKVDTLRVH